VPESELAPVLSRWVTNARPGVRLMAATQLAALGPKSKEAAGRAFAQLLDESSPGIRETAVEGLSKLGPGGVAATARLCRLLTDRDPKLREQAATALGEIGPAAGAQSVRALEEAIQVERLLANNPGVLSAMARQRAERMSAALERIRNANLE
jgi:HEAT repeat protein